MAKLVTAIACTHNPLIFWNNTDVEVKLKEAFDPVRKRLRDSNPDALIVIANDHVMNFFLDNIPSFAVGIAPKTEGSFIGDRERGNGMPLWKGAVKEDVAKDILKKGLDLGIDFSSTQQFKIDHAFIVPLLLCLSNIDIPIIPIFTNCLVHPIPTTRRFFDLGQVLKKVIDSRPDDERYAVLASINYSGEVGTPNMGSFDTAFDEKAEGYLLNGSIDQILSEFTREKLLSVGNTTCEYLNYVALSGMIGSAKPSYYVDFRAKLERTSQKCPLAAWDLVS